MPGSGSCPTTRRRSCSEAAAAPRCGDLLTAICACQPAGAIAASDVLIDGFDGTTDFAEGGGLYYKKNFEQSAGSVEFQSEVTSERRGRAEAERQAALPERIRIPAANGRRSGRRPTLRVPYDQGVWYGFAVKFADPIPHRRSSLSDRPMEARDRPRRGRRFQPVPGVAPAQRQAVRHRRDQLHRAGRANAKPGAGGVVPGQRHAGLAAAAKPTRCAHWSPPMPGWTPEDGSLFTAAPTAIEVIDHGNTLPAPAVRLDRFRHLHQARTRTAPAMIEIFANGKPMVTVKGHIGHADKGLGKNQYFKFGPYRAAHTTRMDALLRRLPPLAATAPTC